MALPKSFLEAGFVSAQKLRGPRRLMLGIDGPPDSGKTEFAWSAPGPIVHLGIDRGHEGALDNPAPPPARREDIGFFIVKTPVALLKQERYVEMWQAYLTKLKEAVVIPEARTVVIDGDSDSWELQRLAEFGKLTQVPSIMYTAVNNTRRMLYSRLFDTGKNIIATSKVKKTYADVLNADGTVALMNNGEAKRAWDGGYESQGFNDQGYVWQIRLMMVYDEEAKEFTATITKCKQNKDLEGFVLRGAECNFSGLVQTVFPDVPLSEWGL